MNSAQIKNKLIDSIWPRRCPVCHGVLKPGITICKDCIRKLSFVQQPTCMKCGKEIADDTAEYCYDCSNHERTYEYGMSLINYDEIARDAMVQIKYKNKREYIEPFAKMIVARYAERIKHMKAQCMIPVPVHPSRLRQRGYNQAEVLARAISKRMNIPVRSDILMRNKKTMAQKALTPQERLNNLTAAFAISENYINGRNTVVESAILIDDIYTTGSTIEACTRVLKAAGVKRIYYISICIGGES